MFRHIIRSSNISNAIRLNRKITTSPQVVSGTENSVKDAVDSFTRTIKFVDVVVKGCTAFAFFSYSVGVYTTAGLLLKESNNFDPTGNKINHYHLVSVALCWPIIPTIYKIMGIGSKRYVTVEMKK